MKHITHTLESSLICGSFIINYISSTLLLTQILLTSTHNLESSLIHGSFIINDISSRMLLTQILLISTHNLESLIHASL